MLKSLRNIFLFVISATSLSLFGQTVAVPWTGTPGEVEAAVAANGGTGTFQLEDGKVYLMLDHIPVPQDGVVKIMGSGSTNMHPATLQPNPNSEGVIGLTDGQMFNLVGDNGELHLHDLILRIVSVDIFSFLINNLAIISWESRFEILCIRLFLSHPMLSSISFFT